MFPFSSLYICNRFKADNIISIDTTIIHIRNIEFCAELFQVEHRPHLTVPQGYPYLVETNAADGLIENLKPST